MKVLVLGASGEIGTAIAREFIAHGHQVVGLSRSAGSDEKLAAMGAGILRGDLRAPESWCDEASSADAIVQVAATFSDDMGAVDRRMLEALENVARQSGRRPRLLYTGGCWLYGATGDAVADESFAFNPIAAFAWMVENGRMLLRSPHFQVAIIHPAMVYHEGGGVFSRFIENARARMPVDIWGSPQTRWPLVHRDDLAVAYRLLAERHALTGHFNASAQAGVRVAEIASAIARRFAGPQTFNVLSRSEVVEAFGDWAEGPTLDQQMSSEKLRGSCGWRPRVGSFETVFATR